jgi:uncharacterized membrane protein
MQVLPAGTTIPPPGYLFVLLLAVVAVALALRRVAPQVTDRVVVAFAPWMVAGSSLYVLHEVGAIPRIAAPFFGSPAVYVSVAVVAGAVWAGTAAAERPADRLALHSVPGVIALTGSVVAVAVVGWTLFASSRRGLTAFWPAVGLVIAAVLGAAVWAGLRRIHPVTRITGATGGLCVFGHTLDGISTAVGIDILGASEQSPVSRAIIEFAAGLPTASVIGAGWLFVLVKLVLAAVVVILLSGYVREEPAEGYLLLGAVAAVGLGPGVHNLLLFTIVSP